ncbi:hypothetical protein KY337_00860 [Candidatus Woesearchaeota archaeon]|nr:hypothetical protein [Candidatus Woesearchaeota archaeon]
MSLTSKISKLMVGIAAAGMLMAAPVKAESTMVFKGNGVRYERVRDPSATLTNPNLYVIANDFNDRRPLYLRFADIDGLDKIVKRDGKGRHLETIKCDGYRKTVCIPPVAVTGKDYLFDVHDRKGLSAKIFVTMSPWFPKYKLVIGRKTEIGFDDGLGLGQHDEFFPKNYICKPNQKIELCLPRQGLSQWEFDPDEYIRSMPKDGFKIRRIRGKRHCYRIIPQFDMFTVQGIGQFYETKLNHRSQPHHFRLK